MKKTYIAKAGATALATLIIASGVAAPSQAATSSDNAINTYSRAEVAAAYNSRWLPTTNSPIYWSGDAATCDAGSQSADSLAKGAQAINFYRGLAGLDSISLTASQNALAQETALLMEANGTISHTPSSDWECYSVNGAKGASTSNLFGGGGYFSIDSAGQPVKAYMDETGSNNAPVGHRRWVLNPDTVTMGMGTTKGFNALNIYGAPTDATNANPTMISFPGSGYFPQQLEPNGKWSVSSDKDVDFSAASVSVKDESGTALGVIKLSTANGYGPNTISFQVQGLSYASGTAEKDYTVTVTNMKKNDLPFAYTYKVRLFDGTVSTSSVVSADPMPTLPTPPTPVLTVYPDYPALGSETYTIPSLEGVVYKVNGVVTKAGTYNANTLIKITAEAASSDYKISGLAAWSKDYTSVVAQPITVTPKAPTFTVNSYVIPYQDGVDYKVNGASTLQGTYTAGAPISITAVALSGYKLTGTTAWSKDFSPVITQPVTIVTPKAPTLGSTSYTIPSVTGVEYLVDGKVKAAGNYSANTNVTIVARAKAGYVLSGTSSWSKNFTVVVKSPLAVKAASLHGSLGAATSREITGLKNGGSYQNYQRGSIVYSPASGAHISFGAIRGIWAKTGYEKGGLGYPTSDEIGGLKNGGVYQKYQGGMIYWSPASGAHISFGAIRGVWAKTGYERGVLGYPVTDEIGLKNGGVYQKYQGGSIYYVPGVGTFITRGAIGGIWGSTGNERGRLGYPTSNEYVTSPGHVAQNFQGGTIKWSSKSHSIVYKK